MSKTKIAIIGSGPRGTYSFAALARRLATLDAADAEILFIDPYISKGGEVYHTEQPSYLLMNTIAEQITAQPDHSITCSTDITHGSSLAEWFRSNVSDLLKPNAYLPRRFHGEYLLQARHSVAALLPKSASVQFIESEVVAISKDDGAFSIRLGSGTQIGDIASVLITTGRGTPENLSYVEDAEATIENPYPIEQWAYTIKASDVVGVQGLGLTAIDVILALTVGRGGAFEEQHGHVTYKPSGREPKIVAWSRSGIPLLARAINQKGIDGRHIAQFLTFEKVDELRRQSVEEGRSGKLDFHKEIVPLISKEIAMSVCLSYFHQKLPTEGMKGEELLSRMFPQLPPELKLDWEKLQHYSDIPANNHAEYMSGIRKFLEDDLKAACEGNMTNPYKCAADCLRDIRDQIRAAVDWGGLTPQSMERFENEFVPAYLRLAVGPPIIRIKQFLALSDAGILDLGLGPKPELSRTEEGGYIIQSRFGDGPHFKLDKLIKARITSVPGGKMANALMQSGLCRLAENRFGEVVMHYEAFDVDRNNRALDAAGKPVDGLFIFGALCEGVNWYTFAAARPFVGSRTLRDAENWAELEVSRLFFEPPSNPNPITGEFHDHADAATNQTAQYSVSDHSGTDGGRHYDSPARSGSIAGRRLGIVRGGLYAA